MWHRAYFAEGRGMRACCGNSSISFGSTGAHQSVSQSLLGVTQGGCPTPLYAPEASDASSHDPPMYYPDTLSADLHTNAEDLALEGGMLADMQYRPL